MTSVWHANEILSPREREGAAQQRKGEGDRMRTYRRQPSGTVARARDLRRHATDAEKALWRALRENLPAALRRQVPVGPYFADFFSFSAKLVLEVDGGQHADAAEYDAARTRCFEAQGYRVLRFWNNDVLTSLDGVLSIIAANLPLPSGEGDARPHAINHPHPPSLRLGPSSPDGRGGQGVTDMPLLEARKQYKPFEYPWAFDYWKRQQQIHWMPEEVPLGEDCRDWAQKLTDHERSLLTQIFRFFTQADVEVQDCYHEKYGRIFKPSRSEDDARRLLQHGDGAHRRLLAPPRHDRHARERIWHVPPV